MQTKRILATFASVTLFSTLVFAQNDRPTDNINARRHPALAAAQRASTQAYQQILRAQQANEYDLGGHAAKAKELLEQVNRELAAAAHDSNRDEHRENDRH